MPRIALKPTRRQPTRPTLRKSTTSAPKDTTSTPLTQTPTRLTASDQEQLDSLDSDDPRATCAKSPSPLPPPVDASKFEQVNEGPAPLVDPTDHTTDVGAEDVVDASADIEF